MDDFIKTPSDLATSNVLAACMNEWGAAFLAVMRTIDVPSEFMAERDLDIPPLAKQFFAERDEDE